MSSRRSTVRVTMEMGPAAFIARRGEPLSCKPSHSPDTFVLTSGQIRRGGNEACVREVPCQWEVAPCMADEGRTQWQSFSMTATSG